MPSITYIHPDEPNQEADKLASILDLLAISYQPYMPGMFIGDPSDENRVAYLLGVLLDGLGSGSLLPAGTYGDTIRYDATDTPISDNFLYNNGSAIGIGTTSPQGTIHVKSADHDASSTILYLDNDDASVTWEIRSNGHIFLNNHIYSTLLNGVTSWGEGALTSLTTGTEAVAIGYNAAFSLKDGFSITASGYKAGYSNVSGYQSSYFGTKAGYRHTGAASSFNGFQTGYYITSKSHDTITGFRAGTNADVTHGIDGNYLTIYGSQAGQTNTDATIDNSTYIGAWTISESSNEAVFGGIGIQNIYLGVGKYANAADITDILIQPHSATSNSSYYANEDDKNGVDLIFAVSQSTGTGTSGDIIWKYAPTVESTGSNQNALVTGLTFSGSSGLLSIKNLLITSLAGSGSEIITVGNDGSIGSSSFTAKGDILVYDGTNVTKFAAGSNDTLLAYDSTSATGLKTISISNSAGTVCAGNDSRLNRMITRAGDQAITAAINWTGTTAPSGTPTNRYRWNRVDDFVIARFRLDYPTPGAGITAVTIDWPSDMPLPSDLTGTDNGEYSFVCSGNILNSMSLATGIKNSTCAVLKDGSGNFYILLQPNSSQSATGAIISLIYISVTS